MIGLVLNPVVLLILLWLVARHEAELEFSVIFLVSLGIGLGSMAISHVLAPYLGMFTLIPIAMLAIYLLMRFCHTSLQRSAIVVGLFIAYQIGFALLLQGV